MEVKELNEAPDLAPLYAKALAGSLPIIGGGGDELPENELTLAEVEIDPEHLAEYCRVCGFAVRDRLPVTYPHVLGFPLAMKLMTDRSFPLPLLGLVHITNRIEQRRPIGTGENLTLKVRAQDLRPHDKGRQVDLVTDALVGNELMWTGTATYLKRGGGGSSSSGEEAGKSSSGGGRDSQPELKRAAVWKVPGHIGRAYAGVSGDRNPIHLHPLSARLFGFPTAIAHGMWAKARVLAAFEGRLPEALETEVAFKKPLLLPGRVAFETAREDGGWAFELRDAKRGAPHLTGYVRPLG